VSVLPNGSPETASDSDLVPGTVVERFAFDVEQEKIREFATAIKDPALRYRSQKAAAAEEFDRVPAPLTFSVVAGHYRDRVALVARLGLDIDRIVVGEVEWRYERPILAGDRLTGLCRVAEVRTKAGARGGAMTFVTLETEFRDQNGKVPIRQRELLIETEASPV
jgi:hypothetical protein